MKVSIIVPAYNVKDYLVNTVELLKRQSLRDIEIILVDDGSTDGTGQLCDEIAKTDGRIKVLHIPNGGVSTARNAGIAAASGEYIGFADADDEPSLLLFETLYRNAVDHNCQLCCAKYAMRHLDGKIVNAGGTGQLHIYGSRSDIFRDYLCEKVRPGIYTVLIKREVCMSIAFEEGRRINEDKMFIVDAIRKADSWCCLDSALYTYIKRNGSASTSPFSDKFLDAVYFSDKIQQIIRAEYPELEDCGKVYAIEAHLAVLQRLCCSGQKRNFENIFREYCEYLRKYSVGFCRMHLKRNSFIKWLCIKIHPSVYDRVIRGLARG